MSKIPVIAVVDDDESFRKAITGFIRSLGYAAATFASAEAFLESNSVQRVDCLITDVQMDGMTGIELQGRLIAQGEQLPIIFVTAFPQMKTREEALARGAIGFLDKPFTDENLVSCLNAALTTHWDQLCRPLDWARIRSAIQTTGIRAAVASRQPFRHLSSSALACRNKTNDPGGGTGVTLLRWRGLSVQR